MALSVLLLPLMTRSMNWRMVTTSVAATPRTTTAKAVSMVRSRLRDRLLTAKRKVVRTPRSKTMSRSSSSASETQRMSQKVKSFTDWNIHLVHGRERTETRTTTGAAATAVQASRRVKAFLMSSIGNPLSRPCAGLTGPA